MRMHLTQKGELENKLIFFGSHLLTIHIYDYDKMKVGLMINDLVFDIYINNRLEWICRNW